MNIVEAFKTSLKTYLNCFSIGFSITLNASQCITLDIRALKC